MFVVLFILCLASSLKAQAVATSTTHLPYLILFLQCCRGGSGQRHHTRLPPPGIINAILCVCLSSSHLLLEEYGSRVAHMYTHMSPSPPKKKETVRLGSTWLSGPHVIFVLVSDYSHIFYYYCCGKRSPIHHPPPSYKFIDVSRFCLLCDHRVKTVCKSQQARATTTTTGTVSHKRTQICCAS